MKKIQAFPIWKNGQTSNVNVLDVYGINVVLGVSAIFKYVLYSEKDNITGQPVAEGSLTMTKEDYLNWKDDDSFVWNWVASKLKLTITGDFVRIPLK